VPRRPPAFPSDVAAALQRAAGAVTVRFVLTGSAAEGARVARCPIGDELLQPHAHWQLVLAWDPETLSVDVRLRS